MSRFVTRPLLLALTIFATAAQAAPTPAPTTPLRRDVIPPPSVVSALMGSATCFVTGSPVEFPNGLQVTNSGKSPLPAGTIIAYKIDGGPSGEVKLTKSLDPKAYEYFSNANPGGVPANLKCKATVK